MYLRPKTANGWKDVSGRQLWSTTAGVADIQRNDSYSKTLSVMDLICAVLLFDNHPLLVLCNCVRYPINCHDPASHSGRHEILHKQVDS